MSGENPCLTCGACCAFFRVSFYWREADAAQGGSVPPELTGDADGFRRYMLGTDRRNPRCVALQGAVGTLVSCAIYERRPSPCREFGIDWHGGMTPPGELDRCNHARAAYGLPPLTTQDVSPPRETPALRPPRARPRAVWRRPR